MELLFEAMVNSKVGRVAITGEQRVSIQALKRFHKLFWEVGKGATEANLRIREEMSMLLMRCASDEGGGCDPDLVSFCDFQRICRWGRMPFNVPSS